jgi:hypothetical protein
MPRKVTLKDLEEQATKAEERAKELRDRVNELTAAEEAKWNAEIIKAIHEWNDAHGDEKHAWSEVAGFFLKQAENVRKQTEERKKRAEEKKKQADSQQGEQ